MKSAFFCPVFVLKNVAFIYVLIYNHQKTGVPGDHSRKTYLHQPVRRSLAATIPSGQTGSAVADTLDALCRHCDLYDAARVSSNPFHPELLRAVAAANLSPDALFALFECLAVLVHLRKLAHPAIPLDEAEEELLFQFEHSGEWLPDDVTLVARWYWHVPAVLLGH